MNACYVGLLPSLLKEQRKLNENLNFQRKNNFFDESLSKQHRYVKYFVLYLKFPVQSELSIYTHNTKYYPIC